MKKSGADILISELRANGVEMIFGYPGGSILPVYDALYGEQSIRHVLSADERGAVFMADGYARAGGKVGVCMATSGPGATNLVTGIAAAFMDSVPMVIITGNVYAESLGHDCFQEVDTTGITMPVTKYNYIVKSVDKLADAVSEAFLLADSGRKGPVLIDISGNVFNETCEYVHRAAAPKKVILPDAAEIANAAKIINSATRPLIYAGGGVNASGTGKSVLALAKKLNAPVGLSLMGIGAIPADDPLCIGVGTSVNRLAKEALKNCAVLISLGARITDKASEKALYNKKVQLVHLDIDAAEIGKIHFAEGGVHGDLRDTLPLLIDAVNAKDDAWLKEVQDMKEHVKCTSSTAKEYIKCLNEHFGNNQIVSTAVGQHQLWTANYYKFDSPRKLLTSGGLGAMGYGIGAAIGAYFATGEPVLMITGDGSFNMNFNELLTVKNYHVPLTVAIMDNSSLGLIHEEQARSYDGRFIDSELSDGVDYSTLAKAFGIDGYLCESPEQLKNVLRTLDGGKPVVIDCKISKKEKAL